MDLIGTMNAQTVEQIENEVETRGDEARDDERAGRNGRRERGMR